MENPSHPAPIVTFNEGTGTLSVTNAEAFVDIQWCRDGVPISGATAASYTLTSADLYQVIHPRVTIAEDGRGHVQVDQTSNILYSSDFNVSDRDVGGWDGWTVGTSGAWVLRDGVVCQNIAASSSAGAQMFRETSQVLHSIEATVITNVGGSNTGKRGLAINVNAAGSSRCRITFTTNNVAIGASGITGSETIPYSEITGLSAKLPMVARLMARKVKFVESGVDAFYAQIYIDGIHVTQGLNSGKGFSLAGQTGGTAHSRVGFLAEAVLDDVATSYPIKVWDDVVIRQILPSDFQVTSLEEKGPFDGEQAQILLSGHYKGSVAQAEAIMVQSDGFVPEGAEFVTSATNGNGSFTDIETPLPPALYGSEGAKIVIRDAADPTTGSSSACPTLSYFPPYHTTKFGQNVNAWRPFSDSAFCPRNPIVLGNWTWNDQTPVEGEDYFGLNGYPTGLKAPGKTHWRCTMFSASSTGRQGTFRIKGLDGCTANWLGLVNATAVDTAVQSDGTIACTIGSGPKTSITLVITSVGANFDFSQIEAYRPGDAHAGDPDYPVDDQFVTDWGAATGNKYFRAMKIMRAEVLRYQHSNGRTSIFAPCATGDYIGRVCKQMGLAPYLTFPVNHTDADVAAFCEELQPHLEGWAVPGPVIMEYGNENPWNNTYDEPNSWLMAEVVRRGFVDGVTDFVDDLAAPGTLVARSGADAGKTRVVLPAGMTILCKPKYTWALIRTRTEVPDGVEVNDDALSGTQDDYFEYLANYADLLRYVRQLQGIRLAEMKAVAEPILGVGNVKSCIGIQKGELLALTMDRLAPPNGSGVPTPLGIDYFAPSAYISANYAFLAPDTPNGSYPWFSTYASAPSDCADAMFDDLRTRMNDTFEQIDRHRREVENYFRGTEEGKLGVPLDQSVPEMIIYESGPHLTVTDDTSTGTGFDRTAMKNFLVGIKSDQRMYDLNYDLFDGCRKRGIVVVVNFCDYEETVVFNSDHFQMFGNLPAVNGVHTGEQRYASILEVMAL